MHEALAQLFRNRPRLAPELLERALGVRVPAFADARVDDATFADLRPAEYRADLVVLLADKAPVLAIVVEVQLARDSRKLFSWPRYAVGLRARFECPACVLVITVTEDVAAWAREPIALGPNSVFTPLVIGPESVPLVVSAAEAAQDPELFVLSVIAHGRDNNDMARTMLPAAIEAARAVDVERAVLYFDLIAHSLGPVIARAFEDLMDLENYEFQSDFFRRLIARHKADATAEGKAEGLAAGKAEGLAAGKAEGLAAGKAESVLVVLRARGLEVSASIEARIRGARELAELDQWLALAVSVESADALFGG